MKRKRSLWKAVIVPLGLALVVLGLMFSDAAEDHLLEHFLPGQHGEGRSSRNIVEATQPPPPAECDLSVTFDVEHASVVVNPPDSTYTQWVTNTYPYETSVSVLAVPGPNRLFQQWSALHLVDDEWVADDPITTNPAEVSMTVDRWLHAVLIEARTLTVSIQGEGLVDADPEASGGLYPLDSEVVLTATPAAGYAFDHWIENGVTLEQGPTYNCVMDEDKNLVAVFVPAQSVQVSVGQEPDGETFVPDASVGLVHFAPDWPGGQEAGAVRTEFYIPETEVSLTAEYELGYAFEHWEDLRVSPTTGPLGVEYNTAPLHSLVVAEGENHEIKAVFEAGKTLTATVGLDDPSGTYTLDESVGSILMAPDYPGGIIDGLTRTETYLEDSAITVFANAGVGFAFDHWEGAATGTTNPVPLLMDADKALTAVFVPATGAMTHTFTTTTTGGGTIIADPSGPYPEYSGVTLTAVPDAGWRFKQWEGDMKGTLNPSTLYMDSEKSVEAIFVPNGQTSGTTYTLTVEKSGNGTVNPPVGVHTFDAGAIIELQALRGEPLPVPWLLSLPGGSLFYKWTEDMSSSDNPESITMNGDKVVKARFIEGWLLHTSHTGEGSTGVLGSGDSFHEVDGLVWPPSVSNPYTLLAAPDPGWTFSHWRRGYMVKTSDDCDDCDFCLDPLHHYNFVLSSETEDNPIAQYTWQDTWVEAVFVSEEPHALSITLASPNPTSEDEVQFLVAFNEAVVNVDAGDFDIDVVDSGVTGAAITNVAGSGEVWTVTVDTGSGEGRLSIDLRADATITNPAGTPIVGGFDAGESYMVYTPPTAGFSANPELGVAPLSVQFTDTSTTGEAPITEWAWDFGDDAESSEPSPQHTYAAGVYTASLTVTSHVGSDTTSATVTAEDAPTAGFEAEATVAQVGEPIQFTDASTPGNVGDITSWSWDFGDSATSENQNPTHAYGTAGTYTVALTVTKASGATDQTTRQEYIVVEDPPTAEFWADKTTAQTDEVIQFTDDSVSGEVGDITGWSWDFGDEATSEDQNPTHAYAEAGTYTVTLTVSKASGATDDEVKTDYITVLLPSLPDLVVSDVGTGPPGSIRVVQPFTDFSVVFTVTNSGTDDAPARTDALFLSRDDQLDPADKMLVDAPGVALATGASETQTLTVTATEMPEVAPGAYWIIIQPDANQDVAESNETNNAYVGANTVIVDPVMTHE